MGRPPEMRPRQYRVEPDGFLLVDWEDGHQSRFAPARLRAGCPCAGCREGSPRTAIDPSEPGPEIGGSIGITGIEAVGRYGIAPVWSDGHRTGIYSWDVLRDLCDCFACGLERGSS